MSEPREENAVQPAKKRWATTDCKPDYPADLPEQARDIADLIGLTLALRLVAKHGGQVLYFPARAAGSDHWLVRAIGPQAAAKLRETYAGTVVSIPRCAALLRNLRDGRIIAAYDAGTPPRTIAREHHITERHVWRVLNRVIEHPLDGAALEQLEFEL